MKTNDFDFVASFYDKLAYFIFQKSIIQAQLKFVDKIPENANVLIIGGGTGWILREILKVKSEVNITYIELSEKMLKKSKTQLPPEDLLKVVFVHGDENSISITNYPFDVIITNFFLDVFNADRLSVVMGKLHEVLVDNGLWINTDFNSEEQNRGFLKKWFIKLMLSFFQLFSKLEARELLNFRTYFEKQDLTLSDSHSYFFNMIHADLYYKLR